MSDRRDAFFLQLVDEKFFDECFDDLENADRLLAVDLGFTGITSGVVVTQHVAPPDLTVDITAGVSYDQAGRRCGITSAENAFNCAVDENAVSTAVAAPGNERWLSIQLRFDRTLTDPQIDGNGNTVFVDQDESYELAVVMGPEQAAGTGLAGPAYTGRPALPTDGRLACDVLLIFGQSQIVTVGDIFTERRQDFSIFSAADIPVTSGAWGFLSPMTDDVQAVLNFIDSFSIVTDASRELLQDIIPSVAGRNLGEAAKEWDLYVLELVTVAASRVDGNLLPKASGNDLGSAALLWSVYADLVDLTGNLDLDGEFITSAASRVNGSLIPKAGTEVLGSAALRWASHMNAITHYGALEGSHLFDAGKQVADVLVSPVDAYAVADWTRSGAFWIMNNVGPSNLYVFFRPPHGAVLDEVKIRWFQTTGTTMVARIFTLDLDGNETAIGASKTISTAAAKVTDSVSSGLATTVNRKTTAYCVKIVGGSSVALHVYSLLVTYTASDILKAALSDS